MRLSETASRFEVGTPSTVSFIGAAEAVKLLLNFGIENIEKQVLKLTDYLIEKIKTLGLKLQTPEEPQHRSGIVNFKIDKPKEVLESLKRNKIVVSARANGIRVSPHFYNTELEIDKLIEEIKKHIGLMPI
ncbi:MAG: aminotransferase class V-fold PLP-dependent enzyme [Candidatus Bathyarchaeia archaeon]